MEVCAGFDLIAIENAAALGHDSLEISKRREAQMIRHMRHGSPPRLMALRSIRSLNGRESLPAPSPGDRITHPASVAGSPPSATAAARHSERAPLWRMGLLREAPGPLLRS